MTDQRGPLFLRSPRDLVAQKVNFTFSAAAVRFISSFALFTRSMSHLPFKLSQFFLKSKEQHASNFDWLLRGVTRVSQAILNWILCGCWCSSLQERLKAIIWFSCQLFKIFALPIFVASHLSWLADFQFYWFPLTSGEIPTKCCHMFRW